jgi:predicted Zn-dependent protease
MSFVDATRGLFDALADAGFAELRPGEELTLNLAAEDQTYVRFNGAKVRQATAVAQRTLALSFQADGRRVVQSFDLTGHLDPDRGRLVTFIGRARAEAAGLPEDPFLVPVANHGSSEEFHPGQLADPSDLIQESAAAAAELDFAGLLAAGPLIRANRNSAGQRHWFANESLFLDYSLYTVNEAGENKAVKGFYAGRSWDPVAFATGLQADRVRLELLRRPARTVPPGGYRTYFAPAAVDDLIGMFSWGGVSYGDWKRGDSALQRLIEGRAALSERFSLTENFGLGLCPRFNSLGEIAPERLPVIEAGALRNLLVSSRSAREYGAVANGAEPEGGAAESLRSPEVAAGDLAEADLLAALGTGLYLGNLHYLNWSDPLSARITGMTRYACFWVEQGEIVAPIRDLRFDESLYRIFGSELLGLTRNTEVRMNTDTYQRRSLGGSRVPGILLGDFRYTS